MELILVTAVVASLIATCVYLLGFLAAAYRLPDTLPWVGRRDEIFAKMRACMREFTVGDRTLVDGYSQYSRNCQAFIIPDPSLNPQVILPPEHVQWVLEQPDNILGRLRDNEKLGLRYMTNLMKHPDNVIKDTIRKDLTRNLIRQHAEIVEEIRESVDDVMGRSDLWNEINLYEAMEKIVLRSSSRSFVGLPLCRNENYQSAVRAMMSSFATGSLALRFVPWFARPVAGFFLSLPYKIHKARAMKFVLPLVAGTLATLFGSDADLPNNYLSWMVAAASHSGTTTIANREVIAEKFLMVGIGFLTIAAQVLAMDSTIVTATSTFLDLLSSHTKLGYYDTLRDESAKAFEFEKNWDDWTALSKLPLIDSAIRETLRRNPQPVRSRQRHVVPKNGITLPDGHHLPKDSRLGFSVPGIHFDDRFYHHPKMYDPFRFVTAQASNSAGEFGQENTSTDPVSRPWAFSSIVVTSNTFLAFGHGRHACPGRFFAAHILKILVAYITLNYEIQPLQRRPQNILYIDKVVPPRDTIIKVRRRC